MNKAAMMGVQEDDSDDFENLEYKIEQANK